MQPIPPSNTKVGLPVSDATKAAWANPNDKPVEEYAEQVIACRHKVSPSAGRREACLHWDQRGAEPFASRFFHAGPRSDGLHERRA